MNKYKPDLLSSPHAKRSDLIPSHDLRDLRRLLEEHLLEQVVPFWLKHALDASGGINTCIRDDGSVVSRKKWLWSQWRAVWVFSELCRYYGKQDAWYVAARQTCNFLLKHGWDEQQGGWRLLLDAQGKPLRGCESLYTDAFAMYGLTALSRIDDDPALLEWACTTADHALHVLKRPHDQIPHFPYPVPPGARVHGLPMIFSLKFWELGQHIDCARYRQAAMGLHNEIFQRFYDPKRQLILERIAQQGGYYPGRMGTAVVPGHVIENMWFQMHIAADAQNHVVINQCIDLIKRHLIAGWDEKYGGLFLAIDADGEGDVGWEYADAKVWWPHTEAMYACLLAYEYSGDREMLTHYDRVHQYAFAHFPDAAHGEWRQRLDRQGRPLDAYVSLPVKDPFHLPRSLLLCLQCLDRLLA